MLQPSDYSPFGIVATHCDLRKLEIAENEAYRFDVSELFCDTWDEIIEIWDELIAYDACVADPECIPVVPVNLAEKRSLIYGGEYTGCNGKTRKHYGVKDILIYYSYARYVILNGFNDTATGVVKKTNEFSIPTPLGELKDYADKYRNMGRISFNRTVGFMCANTDIFTWTDCKGCGCGTEKCNGGTKAKGYGFRSANVSKYDNR